MCFVSVLSRVPAIRRLCGVSTQACPKNQAQTMEMCPHQNEFSRQQCLKYAYFTWNLCCIFNARLGWLPLFVPLFKSFVGELWRLEDDMEGEDDLEHSGCAENRPRSQSPFSHFRARAAYLRKSISADDHLDLGSGYSCGAAVEAKSSRGTKGKLKRKFVSSTFTPESLDWNDGNHCTSFFKFFIMAHF